MSAAGDYANNLENGVFLPGHEKFARSESEKVAQELRNQIGGLTGYMRMLETPGLTDEHKAKIRSKLGTPEEIERYMKIASKKMNEFDQEELEKSTRDESSSLAADWEALHDLIVADQSRRQ